MLYEFAKTLLICSIAAIGVVAKMIFVSPPTLVTSLQPQGTDIPPATEAQSKGGDLCGDENSPSHIWMTFMLLECK